MLKTLTLTLTSEHWADILTALDWYADDRDECEKHERDEDDATANTKAAEEARALHQHISEALTGTSAIPLEALDIDTVFHTNLYRNGVCVAYESSRYNNGDKVTLSQIIGNAINFFENEPHHEDVRANDVIEIARCPIVATMNHSISTQDVDDAHEM